ncbi:MAG TPA: methyltransferase [Bacillus bacterium]|nr:methyltransferase [Bacillus sp. (in: firmicutes)]
MKEHYYDKLLNIKTGGVQKKESISVHYHRYEPTPYCALEALFNDYEVNKSDHYVDFGCGKGRLNFYIHYFFQASATGIEMNEVFYKEALENQTSYFKKYNRNKEKIRFQCRLAQDYEIDPLDNRFYFFNPFSIQIFIAVLINILLSVAESKREIELILYYPSEDYVYFLENHTVFELKKEIIVPELYENDSYERFLIYQLV